MGKPVRHQLKNANTITATGSVAAAVPPTALGSTVVVLIKVGSNPTGTSPSMTVSAAPSLDGTRAAAATSDTAITAATTSDHRIVLQNVVEPFVLVTWTVTGTNPSFTNVSIDVLANGD